MKLFWYLLIFLLYPVIASADSTSLSFTPPLTDVSVVFLGNIFGIVDGVLHGTGSQIMGSMFGVFNAAVLALGGIVIMYTLIVGTMNTAHEGQMLGQKWSSIWIPVRSTLGLAFLIPKASGYCLMQIFIMWVVVQGVGAADKIWDAALSYLNRGGVIMQVQMAPDVSLTADNTKIAQGAAKIFSGEVCMAALQKQLENQRQANSDDKEIGSGPCINPNSAEMTTFCNTPVPDFLSSVSAVDAQTAATSRASNYIVPMPNFNSSNALYYRLNGVCGTINWNKLTVDKTASATLSGTEQETSELSRAIGIQQMYMDFLPVVNAMVANDPQMNPNLTKNGTAPYSTIAMNPFGVPYLNTGVVCKEPSTNCSSWGPAPDGNGGAIFSGTEFQGAISDYNGIMMPVLSLNAQAKTKNSIKASRQFIKMASSEGWMMAGSYFFDLVSLNGSATKSSNRVDKDSGLEKSEFKIDAMTGVFSGGCNGEYGILCTLFRTNSKPIDQIESLIDGSNVPGMPEPKPEPSVTPDHAAYAGLAASTANGFIHNSSMIVLPGQPGMTAPKFPINMNIQPGATLLNFPHKTFPCHDHYLNCLDRKLADIAYNSVWRGIVNVIIGFIMNAFNLTMLTLLYIPLSEMMTIFNNGIASIENPGTNPIIALAYMGTAFINYSMELWLSMISFTIIFTMVGLGDGFMAVLMLITPLIGAWIGVMTGIGFTTAYYIPFLPYMIFIFGVIAWLMAVIESMVAGPIIALGVTHPEGDGALGKAEQAIMILMNVFLRPAMMIIGYIAAIGLCYVSVWIINAGFSRVMEFMMPHGDIGKAWGKITYTSGKAAEAGYTNWAALYASFFAMVMYTMLYMTVVQKSFTLIYMLPDKILRWIGGQPEQVGSETAQWAEESKGQLKETGGDTSKAGQKTTKIPQGYVDKGIASANKGLEGAKGGMEAGKE